MFDQSYWASEPILWVLHACRTRPTSEASFAKQLLIVKTHIDKGKDTCNLKTILAKDIIRDTYARIVTLSYVQLILHHLKWSRLTSEVIEVIEVNYVEDQNLFINVRPSKMHPFIIFDTRNSAYCLTASKATEASFT